VGTSVAVLVGVAVGPRIEAGRLGPVSQITSTTMPTITNTTAMAPMMNGPNCCCLRYEEIILDALSFSFMGYPYWLILPDI
jgi:hypothetical protein